MEYAPSFRGKGWGEVPPVNLILPEVKHNEQL